jgi:AcrR family transcriptional regulator
MPNRSAAKRPRHSAAHPSQSAGPPLRTGPVARAAGLRQPAAPADVCAPAFAPPASARERIQEAAVAVFGRRGFRDATVREISREAGVGLGLMNYHFGDKERLYAAVLEHLFSTAFSRYPLDEAPAPKRPPAECLHGWVHAILGRLIGDTGLYREDRGGHLLAMEMANPSPAMDEVIERYIRPQKEALVVIVGALLGSVAKRDPWRLQCCALSVAAQCLHYAYAQPLIARLVFPSDRPGERLDLLTEHITEFSLGGIRAVREGRGNR